MIYIDSEFKCHASNPDGIFRAFDIPFFDDKCITFIEGYMYIPKDEMLTHPNGFIFHGEMITPWKNYAELDAAQREYERQKLLNCLEALQELGVET